MSLNLVREKLKNGPIAPKVTARQLSKKFDEYEPSDHSTDFGFLPSPFGDWEKVSNTRDGKVYYRNHATRETTFDDPRASLCL